MLKAAEIVTPLRIAVGDSPFDQAIADFDAANIEAMFKDLYTRVVLKEARLAILEHFQHGSNEVTQLSEEISAGFGQLAKNTAFLGLAALADSFHELAMQYNASLKHDPFCEKPDMRVLPVKEPPKIVIGGGERDSEIAEIKSGFVALGGDLERSFFKAKRSLLPFLRKEALFPHAISSQTQTSDMSEEMHTMVNMRRLLPDAVPEVLAEVVRKTADGEETIGYFMDLVEELVQEPKGIGFLLSDSFSLTLSLMDEIAKGLNRMRRHGINNVDIALLFGESYIADGSNGDVVQYELQPHNIALGLEWSGNACKITVKFFDPKGSNIPTEDVMREELSAFSNMLVNALILSRKAPFIVSLEPVGNDPLPDASLDARR